ncbi:MAG: phosphatidate cytidylyltransferase, partial [Clostridia bacterium]|nr:phosphatidate cytidylyltransferase [Clostridia bacterium]
KYHGIEKAINAGRDMAIGDYIFDVFVLCIGIVACIEMCGIMKQMGNPVNRLLVSFYPLYFYIVYIINTLVQYVVPYQFLILIQLSTLVAYFFIILIAEAIKKSEKPVLYSWNSILACLYPGVLISLFVYINHIDPCLGTSNLSLILIVTTLLVTMLSDTFAYFVGSLLKGPKLAPKISPKKTISGSVGGLLGGIAAAMVVFGLCNLIPMFKETIVALNFTWWHFLIIGAVGSIVGQIGDLFESYLKRKAGIKDSGVIFPGHGGMLDRVDAMMFCVTATFIFTIILAVI